MSVNSREQSYERLAGGTTVYFLDEDQLNNGETIVRRGTVSTTVISGGRFRFKKYVEFLEDDEETSEVVVHSTPKSLHELFTEEDVIRQIVKHGGLIWTDSDRPIDDLVAMPIANDELVGLLEGAIIERKDY